MARHHLTRRSALTSSEDEEGLPADCSDWGRKLLGVACVQRRRLAIMTNPFVAFEDKAAWRREVVAAISRGLCSMYETDVSRPLPEHLTCLLNALDQHKSERDETDHYG
jgi:hypothetical protein